MTCLSKTGHNIWPVLVKQDNCIYNTPYKKWNNIVMNAFLIFNILQYKTVYGRYSVCNFEQE